MVAKRHSWSAILLGGAAVVALGFAASSIVRQLAPKDRSQLLDPEVLRERARNESQERAKQLLAKLPETFQRSSGPAGKIVPVHLAWEDAAGRGGLLAELDGCLPAGPGVDVVWSGSRLYLMREQGRLQLVWAANDDNDRLSHPEAGGTSVCYDGRFVWASLARAGNPPLLIVLDPQSGATWTLGAEDGLPTKPIERGVRPGGYEYLTVGAVEPGKACVAASGGAAAVSLVEFDPKRGASFKKLRFPETAGEAPAPGVAGAARVMVVARHESPVAILNLTAPAAPGEKPQRRLMLSRGIFAPQEDGPWLIDPDNLAVEKAADNATGSAINNTRIAVHEGALYWVMQLPVAEPPKVVLARARLPKLEVELLSDEMPEGKPVLYNDRLAFLGEKCWLWKPGESKLESVDVQVPWSVRWNRALEPSALPPKIAGEEWELEQVFASRHYGVLASAEQKSGPNSYTGRRLLFQFTAADDPRAKPESSADGRARDFVIDVPAGTAASELKLFAAEKDDQNAQAILGKVVEGAVDDTLRYPVLAREIVRQSLLIAARDQLRWSTRDGTLGEESRIEAKPASTYVVSSRFPYSGGAAFDLQRIEGKGSRAKVWQERLVLNEDEQIPLDFAKLVEAAERWSRETFPDLLRQDGWSGEPNAVSDDAQLSAAAAEWMKQMSFTAQFAVVRELHHAIRRQGESDALLGALVRSYANLGVLSEFHWNSMHEACKARALLYAQRMVARNPQSAEALWHRAYARGLIGLHDSAVADLDAASKIFEAAGDAEEPSRWVLIIDAYCRFETDKLAAFAEKGDYSQFAGLLQFFHWESLKESAAVQVLAQQLMQRNPEDFRLFDAMCESCAISTLHVVTQMAPAVLHRTAPDRLQQLSGLPRDVEELLKRKALREVSLTELADALASTPVEDDADEFSWSVLGRMLRETEFIQLWRRVFFMRFQWSVPTDEFIEQIANVATGHRYRPLIELCSTDARRWQKAAETLADRLEMEELDFSQQLAFQKALGETWQTRWTEQYVAAERRPTLHADDVHRDLMLQLEHSHAPSSVGRRLLKVSSGSPDAIVADLRDRRGVTRDELDALGKKFPHSPQIWKAMARSPLDAQWQRQALQTYIKLSPDTWAYRSLAGQFQREGKLDEWKATLDECLRQPSFGLEHAQLRVQIADYYMERSEWKKARPYAEEAAETWAEWAILCAVRCCQGLGDDKQEGVWRSRVAERYPKPHHLLDLYVWSRRTGLGDAEELFRAIEPAIAATARQTSAESQFMVGLFYHLGKQPREALAAYRKGAEGNADARSLCFSNLWTATLAEELGETELRDQSLACVARLKDPRFSHFPKLAKWLQAMLAAGKEQGPDLAAAREIAAAAVETDRTGVNCFIANFLELTGHKDEAVAFYRDAIAEHAGRFTATYAFVCATLRDRGLIPRTDAREAEKGNATKPEEEPPAQPESK
jgi:tetratricopeptide (TPR) repeat protein